MSSLVGSNSNSNSNSSNAKNNEKASLPQHCRWAFLGLSDISIKFLRDLLLPRKENKRLTHSLAAVGTSSGEIRARQWLAEHHPGGMAAAADVAIFTSYAELLRHGDFDVVYISTPLGLHFANARDALRSGHSVLLEKPAVVSAAQWRALCGEARKTNTVLLEARWTRYQPAAQAFRDVVLPRLGPIRRIFADFSMPVLPDPYLPANSRYLDWTTGAGALIDLGVYPLTWVDLALNGGDDDSDVPSARVVHAHTQSHSTPSGPIDDITTVVLSREADPPCTVVLTASLSVPGSAVPQHDDRLHVTKNTPSIRVQGEDAEASVPFPPCRADRIHVEHYGSTRVGVDGYEMIEDVHRPLLGWGLWYQADIIGRAVLDPKRSGGLIIGEKSTTRIFTWLDQARELAGIHFKPEMEAVDL
ncbi:NAD(P)-binding protein [Xylariaceae sp. FL0016]|nr:NAD(P)-binding protein [Xylariaceae sp. FL0016]